MSLSIFRDAADQPHPSAPVGKLKPEQYKVKELFAPSFKEMAERVRNKTAFSMDKKDGVERYKEEIKQDFQYLPLDKYPSETETVSDDEIARSGTSVMKDRQMRRADGQRLALREKVMKWVVKKRPEKKLTPKFNPIPKSYFYDGMPVCKYKIYPQDTIGDTTYIALANEYGDKSIVFRLERQITQKYRMFDGDVDILASFYAKKVAPTTVTYEAPVSDGESSDGSSVPSARDTDGAASETSVGSELSEHDGGKSGKRVSESAAPKSIPVKPEVIVKKVQVHSDVEVSNPYDLEKVVSNGTNKEYNIEAFGARQISGELKEWKIPALWFKGMWNNTAIGSGALPFAKHFGIHVRDDSFISIKMPATIVDELRMHWAHVGRDSTYQHFMVTTIKARYLMRFMNLPAKVIADTVLYAPALAYMQSWREQQNISRVVKKQYWTARQVRVLGTIIGLLSTAALVTAAVLFPPLILVGVFGLLGALIISWIRGKSAVRPDFVSRMNSSGRDFEVHEVPSELKEKMRRVAAKFDKQEKDGLAPVYCIGLANKNFIPAVKKASLGNEQKALESRVFIKHKPVDNEACSEFLTWHKNNMDILYGPSTGVASKNPRKWIAECGASVANKAAYSKALDEMEANGITEHSFLNKRTRKAYNVVASFSKPEKEISTGLDAEVDKNPRLISAATPHKTVLCGPWVAAVQGILKKRWAVNNSNFAWAAGEDSGAAARLAFPSEDYVGFKGDHHKFDANQQEVIHQAERQILNHFRAPLAIRQLHTEASKTVGYTMFGWRYIVEWQRRSGDTWTSLFNTAMNRSTNLYGWCKQTKLDLPVVLQRIRALVNGDDLGGSVPKVWVNGNIQDSECQKSINKLGLDLEMDLCVDPYGIEFCSLDMYPSEEGPVFAPKIGRTLAKISWSLTEPKDGAGQFKGVLLSGLKGASVLPPLKSFYEICLAKLKGVTEIESKAEAHKLTNQVHTANSETWYYLDKRYGWDHTKQALWEQWLWKQEIPGLTECPLYDLLVDHDCSANVMYTPVKMGPMDNEIRAVEADAHNSEQHSKNGNTTPQGPHDCSVGYHDEKSIWINDFVGGIRFRYRIDPESMGLDPNSVFIGTISYVSPNVVVVNGRTADAYVLSPMSLIPTYSHSEWDMFDYLASISPPQITGAAEARAHNRNMHSLNGNIQYIEGMDVDEWFLVHTLTMNISHMKYLNQSWLAKMWNKLMHSQNGNMDLSVQRNAFIETRTKERNGRMGNALSKLMELAKVLGVSEKGLDWVIQAFDPFCDSERDTAALPDGAGENVVIQCVNATATIGNPVGNTQPWDVSIVAWPTLGSLGAQIKPVLFIPVSFSGNGADAAYTMQNATLNGYIDGVSWLIQNTGVDCDWTNPGGSLGTGQLTLPSSFVNSPFRVVGAAVEVYNTTPELNKGGSIMVWKYSMPSLTSKTTANMLYSVYQGSASVITAPAPPANLTQAGNIASQRSWDASAGVYMPLSFSDVSDVPSTSGCSVQYLYYVGTPAVNKRMGGALVSVAGQTNYNYPRNNNVTSTNMHGAYFSGLPIQTTLYVSVRFYLETRPSQSDPLITTSKCSYPADPMAIRLYSMIVSKMPSGVPVCENSIGEWFCDAVDFVSTAAIGLGDAFGIKNASILGRVGKFAAGVGKKLIEKPSPNASNNASARGTTVQEAEYPRPRARKNRVVIEEVVQKPRRKGPIIEEVVEVKSKKKAPKTIRLKS
jgi:hypothetical protein